MDGVLLVADWLDGALLVADWLDDTVLDDVWVDGVVVAEDWSELRVHEEVDEPSTSEDVRLDVRLDAAVRLTGE